MGDFERAARALARPMLEALRVAGDVDSFDVYDAMEEAGIIRREPYDPAVHGEGSALGDFDGCEPGDEIWLLTDLGRELSTPEPGAEVAG